MHSDFLENLDEEPRIDLTPLIDCLFMLIIFFVLTMSFSRPVLDLVLPQAANAVPVRERNELALTVKADGTYELAGEACDLEALGRALDADPERLLNIYMDERAPFASFVAVMDLAKEKRGGKFVISTRLLRCALAASDRKRSRHANDARRPRPFRGGRDGSAHDRNRSAGGERSRSASRACRDGNARGNS